MAESEEKIILLQWHDNNCFAIAVVQCMLNIPPIVDILVQFLKNLNIARRYIEGIDDEFKDKVLMNFAVVAKFIKNNPQGIGNHSLRIKRLLLSVYKLCRFEMGKYGDSRLFLLHLYNETNTSIETFNSRCKQLKVDRGLDLTINTLKSVTELTWVFKHGVCDICNETRKDLRGKETIVSVGTYDFIYPNGTPIYTSFKAVFQGYLNFEVKISCWECSFTNEDGVVIEKGNITRRRYFEKLPQYLIVELSALDDRVLFDCNIETEFEVELGNGKKNRLELSCAVKGQGGHAVSFIKKGDKWFYCDDWGYKHNPKLINNVNDYFVIKRNEVKERFYLFYKCVPC